METIPRGPVEVVELDDPVHMGLLVELDADERALDVAREAVEQAQTTYRIRERKYAAVRDMVTNVIGFDPYTPDLVVPWPTTVKYRGKYRFAEMAPGEAAARVLREAPSPLDLSQIMTVMFEGGYVVGTGGGRVVNAALINTPGIKKTADGKYYYEPPPVKVSQPGDWA